MTNKAKRSSRKRMEGRIKRRSKQQPVSIPIKGTDRFETNRAQRKIDAQRTRRGAGPSRLEQARNSRKSKLSKARRILKRIRKETRKAMKRKRGRK